MSKNRNLTKVVSFFILVVFLISNMAIAETQAQKVLRLRREKQADAEPSYQRKTTLTIEDEEKTPTKKTETPAAESTPAKSETPTPRPTVIEPDKMIVKPAVSIDTSDPLSLVPADALVCVRINNFNNSLTSLDQYLTGVSPMPLSMMATAQIGVILGNPMMTGINLNGNVMLFGRMGPGITDPYVVVLLPVKSYDDFISQNPNASKPDENGIVTITPQGSFLGPVAVGPATGGKFAYVTLADKKQMITAAKSAIKTNKSIVNSLGSLEASRATKMPVWAYGNAEQAVKSFGPAINTGLMSLQMLAVQAAAASPEQMNPQQVETGLKLLQSSLNQIKSLSIAIDPSPQKMNTSIALSAIQGSELAKALKPASSVGKPFTLQGTLTKPAGMNLLMKINKPLMKSYFEMFPKILPGPQSDEMAKIGPEWMNAFEDEMAVSFDFSGETIFTFQSFAKLTKGISFDDLIKKQIKLAGYDPLSSGVNPEYTMTTSSYNSNKVYIAKADMPLDPAKKTTVPIQINYGPVGEMLYSCTGDEAQLHKLIDRGIPSPSAATGDMKTALSLIDNPADYEFVASYNMLRLMSGIGKMQKMMPQAQTGPMNMFDGISTESKSCAAVTARLTDDSVTTDIIIPKTHLLEVYQAIMQMQQKIMQQMMQGEEGDMKMDGMDPMENMEVIEFNSMPEPMENK